MKKLLLATGIFLSFSLIASAQEKKATTATTTPATPAAAIAKQKHNQRMLVHQDNTATKNQIIQDKQSGVNRAAIKKSKKAGKTKTATAPAAN